MKKSKLIPIPKLIKKTEKIFNEWIRERDKNLGCISCGGNVDHCGHYFPTNYSGVRFYEINCNGQCIKCNNYLSGNLIFYRRGLIQKYGNEMIEQLETYAIETRKKKWERDELNSIISKYKK